jgi:uncharacterized iron-regulated protein
MKLQPAVLLGLVLLGACAASAPRSRFVDLRSAAEHEVTPGQVIDDLAAADVVVLGEEHDNEDVHRAYLRIIEGLYKKRSNMVISMEMFERDVQPILTEYVFGTASESAFLAAARPWPNYKTDYRPVVEFAKVHGIPVIAANTPRDLARAVAKGGLEAAKGSPYAAANVATPKDEYWEAFKGAMTEHGSMTADESTVELFYAAQCLKDDTMAESIVERLRKERADRPDTILVHLCGRFHSDYRRGTVARILSRDPELRVLVVSAVEVKDPASGTFTADHDIGNFVVVVPEGDEKAREQLAASIGAGRAAPHKMPGQGGGGAAVLMPRPHNPHEQQPGQERTGPVVLQPVATEDQGGGDEGGRPALGFMPDYNSQDLGLRVESVVPGGGAEAAGIVEGDVIVGVGGRVVEDMAGYMGVLGGLKIGSKVSVLIKRGSDLKKLTIKVGSRQ